MPRLFKVLYGLKLKKTAWLQDDQIPPRCCLSHKKVGTSVMVVVVDDDDDDDMAVEENSPR